MSGTPLRFVPIGVLLGDHEGVASLSLPGALGSGSRNLTMDRYGRVRSILGYQLCNPTIPGGDPLLSDLTALHAFARQNGDGSVTRQLLGLFEQPLTGGYQFVRSLDVGVTWEAIGPNYGATHLGRRPTFTQIGNLLLVTNGLMTPARYDGITWENAGDAQPLGAPVVILGATAGLLKGTYQVRVRPVRVDGTKLSASPPSTPFSVDRFTLQIGWAATGAIGIAGYEIYRTSGTGSTFFFEGYASGAATFGYTLQLSDTELLRNPILDNHGDAPPTAYATGVHGGRLWWLRTDTKPRTAYFADAGFPESVYSLNAIDFTDGESWSDHLQGLWGDYKKMGVFFQERSIWTVSGTGEVIGLIRDYTPARTNAEIGTVSMATVVKVPQGARYFAPDGTLRETAEATLAYLTPLKDVRLFDGNDSTVISTAKQDFLGTLSYPARGLSHAVHDRLRGEITWMFTTGTSLTPNVGLTWHYRTGAMTERDWPFRCAIEVESDIDGFVLRAGTMGQAFPAVALWTSYTRFAEPLVWQVTTRPLYGAADARSGLTSASLLSFEKRWRWADALVIQSVDEPITASWLHAEAEQIMGTQALVVSATRVQSFTGDDEIISDDGDTLEAPEWPNVPRVEFSDRFGHHYHARGVRVRYTGSQTRGQTVIAGINVAYQLLTGLKRQV